MARRITRDPDRHVARELGVTVLDLAASMIPREDARVRPEMSADPAAALSALRHHQEIKRAHAALEERDRRHAELVAMSERAIARRVEALRRGELAPAPEPAVAIAAPYDPAAVIDGEEYRARCYGASGAWGGSRFYAR